MLTTSSTEKIPDMFGTLVICLPSAHEGGELVVSHNGSKKSFSTARYQPSFAAWYSDVVHQIKPVTAGYRLVLTYNLAQTGGGLRYSASERLLNQSALCDAAETWLDHAKAPGGLRKSSGEVVFALEHRYTEANFGLSRLKAADRKRVVSLSQLSESLEFKVYLAMMERQIHGGCEEDYDEYDKYDRYGWDDEDGDEDEDDGDADNGPVVGHHVIMDEIDRETKLTRVVGLDGKLLVKDLTIDDDCLIQQEMLWDHDRDPDEEDYEGFTGNAGASATHWYRDSVSR